MNQLNLATINEGLPNLDCMTFGDLTEARAEFKELARHFKDLASYCEAKVEAGKHRAAGRIETACRLESHAETIYNGLPEELKW